MLILAALVPILSVTATSAVPQHDVTKQLHHLRSRAVNVPVEWGKSWCKGGKLAQAMIKSESQAAPYISPVRSPWDGDLVEDLQKWGYREIENHRSNLCDFGTDQHNLKRAFTELGIETASSADGGPNYCYYVEHMYGPTVQRPPDGAWPEPSQQYYVVDGKRYRVSLDPAH